MPQSPDIAAERLDLLSLGCSMKYQVTVPSPYKMSETQGLLGPAGTAKFKVAAIRLAVPKMGAKIPIYYEWRSRIFVTIYSSPTDKL